MLALLSFDIHILIAVTSGPQEEMKERRRSRVTGREVAGGETMYLADESVDFFSKWFWGYYAALAIG